MNENSGSFVPFGWQLNDINSKFRALFCLDLSRASISENVRGQIHSYDYYIFIFNTVYAIQNIAILKY